MNFEIKRTVGNVLSDLDNAGSVGLDMSPGDPVAAEAARIIRALLAAQKTYVSLEIDELMKWVESRSFKMDRTGGILEKALPYIQQHIRECVSVSEWDSLDTLPPLE